MTAQVTPANTSNPSVRWDDHDSTLATIEPLNDGTAVLHALLPGTVNVTATTIVGGLKTTLPIVILPDSSIVKVESVTISPSQISLQEKERAPLTVTVLPKNAPTKALRWSSSNPDVAEALDANGTVSVVAKAPGKRRLRLRRLTEATCPHMST